MDDLELIKSKINIVDLIQEYLPLKKAGVNYKANCPFHQEKTPSFVVSPERGIFHCFGCGVGGDVFKFLMLKEGIEFPEALEVLAKRAGVVLKGKGERGKGKDRLYEANEKASEFYHYLLTKHPLGQPALEYLKKRGLSEETIETFQLGYAPNSWDQLTKFLTKRGFKAAELIEAGLLVPSKKGGYDRFRGRVMFPLSNIKKQIIGFSGRVLGVGEPKYINTPTTSIFDKGNFLFGLEHTKGDIRQSTSAILVEGEMDMIASFQSGVKNIVATKGTALSLGQIELIKKHAQTILLCFDKDLAGDAASRRGIELADAAGLSIKVIEIKGGKDPAEMCLKDPQEWIKTVSEAEPIYDYYLRSVSLRFNPKTADGKKNIAAELIPIWAKISDHITQEFYIQKLAALLGTDEAFLRKELKVYQSTGNRTVANYQAALNTPKLTPINGQKSRRELLEEYLMVLLLKIPQNLTFVPNFPETLFISEELRSLYVLLVLYLDAISFKAKSFNIGDFAKDLSPELIGLLDRLYLIEVDDKLSESKHWLSEVETVIAELKKALIKATLEKLSSEIKNAQAFGKVDQLELLNRRFRDLSVKLKSL